MIKKTIFLSSPSHLSIKNCQLVYSPKGENGHVEDRTFPVEDIGFVVLESPQITLTVPVLQHLMDNNVAVIVCNQKHLPSGMFLNLDGNYIQQEVFDSQINASKPLRKNLWKQTVEEKIRNQARLIKKIGKDPRKLFALASNVKSDDSENQEGVAGHYYWRELFDLDGFSRNPEGPHPNSILNYGYAILRAATARSLAGSGLLCTIGIHHCNRYNAFCLADDIMEPYRPFVDEAVLGILNRAEDRDRDDISRETKAELLALLSCDAVVGDNRRPLMIALTHTTASLAKCFSGTADSITYPILE